MTLLTIVPTRGRPDAARELYAEYMRTRADRTTSILFAIDEDDPRFSEYMPDLPVAPGARERMGPTLNRYAAKFARDFPSETVIGFMGDDHRPRTLGWDIAVKSALAGAPGVAYGDDLIHGPNLPTAAWVSASIVRSLGYIAPPNLIHLYLDNFWLDLGRATNLHYLSDCVFEHLHPIAGKAAWDAGYVEANAGSVQEHDRIEYERYIREDWPTALERIRSGSETV